MTTRKIGESTLVSQNNLGAVLRRMERAKIAATKAMANAAKQQAQEVYGSDGDGSWQPNAPTTIDWKGHDKVMLGRTGTLADDIEIRDSPIPTHKAIGWFDEDHPDSDLSKAELALVQEMDRPWLSKVHDNPQRAEAVLAAGWLAYRSALL